MNFDAPSRGTDMPPATPAGPALAGRPVLETVPAGGLPDGFTDPAQDMARTGLPEDFDPMAAPGEAASAPESFLAALDAQFENVLADGPPGEPETLFGETGPGTAPPAFDPAAIFGDAIPESGPPTREIPAEFEDALLEGLPASAPRLGESAPEAVPPAFDPVVMHEEADPEPDLPVSDILAEFEDALLQGLPEDPSPTGEAAPEEFPSSFEPAAAAGGVAAAPDTPVPETVDEFENALVEGLSESSATSSGDPDPGDFAAPLEPEVSAGDAVSEIDADAGEALRPARIERPAAVLAFAMDSETEDALRQGLLHYQKPSPVHDDPQVWSGGLRAAVAALAGGRSARLVIVDIDGMPYPAGGIHELAEVCEMGTAVIAIGSDRTARSSRELLLAGVSDYLVKPITPAAVRETAARAASAAGGQVTGSAVGFAGAGGSGATTLVAATALQAAERGRYVSVLDLNRTVASSAILLDVEPAAGLDQMLDVAVGTTPDPQLLDDVRTERSQRISVYAYRWSAVPPPVPSISALEWLLGELRLRSQLVLIDGLDDPELRFAVLARVDKRVVVAEPTGRDLYCATRILDLLGDDTPTLLVQNHTREFKRDARTGSFARAGIAIPPDVEIPFEAALPAISDRGWPHGRMPRRLRESLASLTERLLTDAPADGPGLAELSGQG